MNGWILKNLCKNMLISSKNSPPRIILLLLVYDCRNSPPLWALSYYCWCITVSISISWSYHMLRNIRICSGKESTQFALLRWERITSCVPYRCVYRAEAYATHRVGWVMVAGTYMLVHNTTDSGLDADQGRTFLWKYRLAWHGMQNVYSSIMISHPQPPPVLFHHQQYVLLLLHACHALSPMQLINFKT